MLRVIECFTNSFKITQSFEMTALTRARVSILVSETFSVK